ncbi:MAG TPA: hypothetical protein VHT91_13385 [Kofleriaceae bacterium]|nr:hypothetical protein [Kofleriaceae bacterium]
MSSHHQADDLHVEQPVFVDPGREDPMAFIEFRRELAVPAGSDARGTATIAALQLNRDALWERRRDRHALLRACVIVLARATRVELSRQEREDAIRILVTVVVAAADHGEYVSMTRSLLRRIAPWRQDWTLPATSLFEALRADAAAGRMLHVSRA